jgi:hypothetical protein
VGELSVIAIAVRFVMRQRTEKFANVVSEFLDAVIKKNHIFAAKT